jgi:hypothetical protein
VHNNIKVSCEKEERRGPMNFAKSLIPDYMHNTRNMHTQLRINKEQLHAAYFFHKKSDVGISRRNVST